MGQRLTEYWATESADTLDALYLFAPVWLYELDAIGIVLRVSAYQAQALGYRAREMEGAPLSQFLSETSAELLTAHFRPQILREGVLHNFTLEFVTSTGVTISTLQSAMAQYDRAGNLTGIISVVFDNSKAIAAQIELAKKAREATEASRAKSRFLGAMSHEIRTPMNAIMGFAQLLKLSNLDEKRLGHVNAIISAGGSLMNMLTDLLDLGHVEEGRMRIDAKPFSLASMIDQVADWWHSSAQEKGLKLEISLDSDLPPVLISDPIRIQQVLNNFLGNAVKFTDTGTIKLRIQTLSRDREKARIRFEVADTGIGMTPAQLDKLFQPFVQIDSEFGKDRGGWGLGLSICNNIALHMDAQIDVHSVRGEGSTFAFEVDLSVAPNDIDATTPSQGSHPHGKPAHRSLRVLLAEDNPLNQEMMCTFLNDMGHHVITVANGFEAVEALIKSDYDLVIMDIMMPGLDGIGATKQIRTTEGAAGKVPIIACSALVSTEARERYRKIGMDAFLPKPIDRDKLEMVISSVVPSSGL